VTDLRDIRDRAVARLMGVEDPGVPELTEPCVIVAHDLAPAETAGLQRDLVMAIVTESGGPTSHTAILAAQMGIPAVVQLPRAVAIGVGTVLAVDGATGEVFVDPDLATRAGLVERSERRAKALGATSGPASTSDGHPVALLANIGTAQDAERAGVLDVEGVGLFRTEFLFLERETAPTLEEQVDVYTRVFEAFGSRRVVVRTLDAGADKPLAFADLGPEENPALGRRGLRLSAERPELLDTQLAALATAAQATGADVRVMAPMVATAEEAAWFARRVRENGLPKVGVMIEVPAAALRARHVLAEVDFASIGTNDLAQYTLAADRMQGELATLLDPWQPAVLDLVAAACDGGRDTGTPIGVCGEAAADPLLALVLTGLGVSSLSMAPTRVPAVRAALSLHDLRTCTAMAAAARASRSPQDARDAVLALADNLITDLV
jgi:phosphotransferase system enzyme I (PtsI)